MARHPLADLSYGDFVHQEVGRLEELRAGALEDKLDLDLALDRYQEAIPDLERLVQENPLRERLRAQLMLALYQAGRQAESLDAYQEARTVLADELGVDPGPGLQRLYERILRQDPSLEPHWVARSQPTPGNLPARIATFIGREKDIEALAGLLQDSRLVTVVGPGGAGKTSLAIELGHHLNKAVDLAVWLIRLAAVGDPSLVPPAMVDALGLSDEGANSSPVRLLGAYLHNKESVLIIDNCEHVVEAAAEISEELLSSCPDLKIVATSREVLGLTGEVVWTIPPLSIPDRRTPVSELPAFGAVRLFEARASAARLGFKLDETTAPAVVDICRRLDGMPLAIELAAARSRSMPVTEIARRLEGRFALLTGGGRTAEPRHRTLRAAIDWSHDLLGDDERILFRRLGAFADGFDLAAAEEVAHGDDIVRASVLDLLSGLVDRSLVAVVDDTNTRFNLLETLREYALERLEQAGETETIQRRHALYYQALAESAELHLRGPEQSECLSRLEADRANFREALVWAAHRAREVDLLFTLAASLGWFWYFRRQEEGREFLEIALDPTIPVSRRARARALQSYSIVNRPGACIVHPHPDCAEAAQQSLDLFLAEGDTRRAALSKALVAVAGVGSRDADACLELLDGAIEEFRDQKDDWGEALCRFVAMEIKFRRGRFDEALADGEAALGTFHSLEDRWGSSAIRAHLGGALWFSGQFDKATILFREALAEARRIGLPITTQWMLAYLGFTAIQLGDVREARSRLREAHADADEFGVGPGAAFTHLGEALIARREGRIGDASHEAGKALELFETQGVIAGATWALRLLGTCFELAGDPEAADAILDRALETALRVGGAGSNRSGTRGSRRSPCSPGACRGGSHVVGNGRTGAR